MLTALVIVVGIVVMIATICAALLIDSGKVKIGARKIDGDGGEVVKAQQRVMVSRAEAQRAFFAHLHNRVLALDKEADMEGNEEHGKPPIDQELLRMLFGETPGRPIQSQIEPPHSR